LVLSQGSIAGHQSAGQAVRYTPRPTNPSPFRLVWRSVAAASSISLAA
jgi:hypothetical protein